MVRLRIRTQPMQTGAWRGSGVSPSAIIMLGARAPYGPAARKASFNHFLAGMNRLQALLLRDELCVFQVWCRAAIRYDGLQ